VTADKALSTRPARVLLVDDDPLVQRIGSRLFAEPEFLCSVASSAAEALEQLQRIKPDVVILDNLLPDGSGLDLLQQINAFDRRLPVLLITVAGSSGNTIEAMKRGAFDFLPKPLDLNVLLRRLCDAMSPAFDRRNIRFVDILAENLPLIAGSSDRLQQLFLNLLNNSLDAMPDGGEVRICTSIEPGKTNKSQQVIVDFSDTGTGMTPEVMSHIFDPLYTTKERGHGTGLGLVIVSQIVAEHGGTIDVESELGGGTRFRLAFSAIPNELSVGVEQRETVVEARS